VLPAGKYKCIEQGGRGACMLRDRWESGVLGMYLSVASFGSIFVQIGASLLAFSPIFRVL